MYFCNDQMFFLFSLCFVQIETRNNKLEMQSVNNGSLVEELNKLVAPLRVPSEVCFYYCKQSSSHLRLMMY